MANRWNVSVLGLGYVGLSHAVAYALKGVSVYIYDIDPNKMNAISKGISPIKEKGIEENLGKLIKSKKVRICSDVEKTILSTNITFIAVNTPSTTDGRADLTQIDNAIKMIGNILRKKKSYHIVVIKSTIPPGTTEYYVKPLLEKVSRKKVGKEIGLCFVPEFLREGHALQDILFPSRIVIGEVEKKCGDFLERFFHYIHDRGIPVILRTTPINAELIKYSSNAFLAMRISFINSIARLCENFESCDIDVISYGIGLDPRIGRYYLKAGPGFGGPCLPKDLKALIATCEKYQCNAELFKAIQMINESQIDYIKEIIEKELGVLKNKKIAILGLSFKAKTDDIRESPSLKLINILLSYGAGIKVFDPWAMKNAKKYLRSSVMFTNSVYECIKDADALVIMTEWEEFKNLTQEKIMKLMNNPLVIDTKRLLKDSLVNKKKIKYIALGIGRPDD